MTLQELRTDARYMISPQLTTDDYPDVDLDRNLNRWYKTVIGWAINAGGDWELGGDIIFHDLTAGKTDISLPRSLIRIYKAEVMYDISTGFRPVKFFNPKDYQYEVEGNDTRVIDNPAYPTADLSGDVITIKPAPENDVVNGLQMWVSLDLTELANTSDIPDLFEAVQRALSLGAAYEYARSEEMWKKAASLKRDLLGDPTIPNDSGVKGMVESLYAERSDEHRSGFRARRGRFN